MPHMRVLSYHHTVLWGWAAVTWYGGECFPDSSIRVPHRQFHFERNIYRIPRGRYRGGVTDCSGATALHSRQDSAAEDAPLPSPLSRARDVLSSPSFLQLLAPMGTAGALLGPNLDNYHSAFGVLTYKNPIQLTLGDSVLVTTDWW